MKALNQSGRIMNLPTFFTHNTLKNCHLEFAPDGCYLWVSLNVTKGMIKHLSPNNIYKGEHRHVYALKKKIDSPTDHSIAVYHEELLKKAMINCREAKMKVIESEICILKLN